METIHQLALARGTSPVLAALMPTALAAAQRKANPLGLAVLVEVLSLEVPTLVRHLQSPPRSLSLRRVRVRVRGWVRVRVRVWMQVRVRVWMRVRV